MNKILIPMLLVGIIIIAGVFSFVPVEQATTLHSRTLEIQVTERNSSFFNANGDGSYTSATVPCLSGEVLVGGGFDANDASTPIIVDDRPNGNGWLVGFKQSGGPTVQVRAIALCATLI